jgi:hypothetical protein
MGEEATRELPGREEEEERSSREITSIDLLENIAHELQLQPVKYYSGWVLPLYKVLSRILFGMTASVV